MVSVIISMHVSHVCETCYEHVSMYLPDLHGSRRLDILAKHVDRPSAAWGQRRWHWHSWAADKSDTYCGEYSKGALDLTRFCLPQALIASKSSSDSLKSSKLDCRGHQHNSTLHHRGGSSSRTYLDSLRGDRLGNNDKALVSAPCDQDLGRGFADLLGDLLNGGSVNDSGLAGDVVAERRVGRDDDTLLLAWQASASTLGSGM